MSNATQPNPIQLKRPDPDACLPQRSPAWRWCTAMYVSDPNCGNPPNSDDPWVQDAAEFLRQCRTGWSEGAIEPTETQRVIREAVALYGNKVQRAILEARLLANETCVDIARHSGIPVSVVEAYEQLFFNVANQICLNQISGSLFQPMRVPYGPRARKDSLRVHGDGPSCGSDLRGSRTPAGTTRRRSQPSAPATATIDNANHQPTTAQHFRRPAHRRIVLDCRLLATRPRGLETKK